MASDRDLDFPVVQPHVAEKTSPMPFKASDTTAGAKCTQCGQTMRHMPLFLKNITCKDCYGTERYRRSEISSTAHNVGLNTPAPEKPLTV